MLVDKSQPTMMQSNAFPYTISQNKPAVEHRNFGFAAWIQFTVNINQDLRVTRVVNILMRTCCHLLYSK